MTLGLRVDTAARMLAIGNLSVPCTIGKGGACPADDKREGDGCTPLGQWPVRGALIRPDRVKIDKTPLIPWRWLRPDDGWSDAPADPAYNHPVRLPYGPSHERLWRDDRAYDIIIVLGHNDTPPVPGMGSAIFFHQTVNSEDGLPKATEGCIAIAPDDMRMVLPLLTPGMVMEIV